MYLFASGTSGFPGEICEKRRIHTSQFRSIILYKGGDQSVRKQDKFVQVTLVCSSYEDDECGEIDMISLNTQQKTNPNFVEFSIEDYGIPVFLEFKSIQDSGDVDYGMVV